MIKNEFKFIGKNKLILLSVLVMTIIPFLYSIFFLKSVWDPYGNTQNLPVAVVNQDEAVTYNGTKLNVGQKTVANLRKNHQLGWKIVSAKQAASGLKHGKYYTVVTIPQNFSKHAASVLTEKPKKMVLRYQTNDSLNYIAKVISEIGTLKLNEKIRAQVTNAYASALFDQLHVMGKGMSKAASGATQLNTGLVTLDNGLNQYTVGVSQVNDGVQTLKVKVSPLSSGVSQLTTGASKLATGVTTYTAGVSQVAAGLSTLNGKTAALATGVSQLASGSQALNNGLGTYTQGVGQVANGLGQLSAKTSVLSSGVTQLAQGSKALNDGAQELNTKLAQQLKNPTQQAQLKALLAGLPQINAGIQQVAQQLEQLSSLTPYMPAMSKLSQALPALQAELTGVGQNATTIGNSLTNIQKILTQLQATQNDAAKQKALTQQLETALTQQLEKSGVTDANVLKAAVANIMTNVVAPTLKDQQSQITTALTDVGQNVATAGQADKQIGASLTKVQTTFADQNVQAALKVLSSSSFQQTLSNLSTNLAAVKTLAASSNEALPGAVKAITNLSAGLTQAQQAVNTLALGTVKLNTGVSQLSTQTPTMIAGITQLNNGAQQLQQNSGSLLSGSTQISSGLAQLNGQVPNLVGGIGQLNNGATQLQQNSSALTSGANQLSSGLTTLNNQIPTLMSGVNTLADGTSQLATKSSQLTSGSKKLAGGSKTLSTSLTAGAKKVNGIHTTKATADMFSAPSKLKSSAYSYVPNYGHALAPYVLSVALYVGCIVFNFAYPIRKISETGKSATAWFFSKVTIGGLVATGMAIVEVTLMILFGGLTVDHLGKMYLTGILFSWASMAIVMFLSMLLDNPGRFLAMVLLMLQLGGSGGTFPMEVTNGFYNAIHPYLPMSYSIYGFRDAISSGFTNNFYIYSTLILVIFLVVSLVLLWLSMQWLQNRHLQGISQLDDNQKLQDVEH